MALGMKSWVGLIAAGCAAVALKALPPSALEPPNEPVVLQEERLERALLADVRLANTRLARLRMADRVIALTLAEAGPLALGVPEDADTEAVERARSGALEELAGASGDVKVGLFYVDWRETGYRGAPTAYLGEAEYYFGARDGRPYCVTVIPVWRSGGRARLSTIGNSRSRTGLCDLVAHHGLPGPAVREWLKRGGTAMAGTSTPSDQRPFAFAVGFGFGFERRGFLGLPLFQGQYFRGLRSTSAEQCLGGVTEGCGHLLMLPDAQWQQGFQWGGARPEVLDGSTPLSAIQARSLLEPADSHVAADLAQEFGQERFADFWTAGGDVETAFRSTFGIDAGAWYKDRVARLVTLQRPGPRVTFEGAVVATLLITLAGVVAGGWAGRRRVA